MKKKAGNIFKEKHYCVRFLLSGVFFWFSGILFLTQVAEIKKDNTALYEISNFRKKVIEAKFETMPLDNLKHIHYPKFSLIIDDIGLEMNSLYELSKLNLPLTISILPYRKYSKEAAAYAKKQGWEVILHLPMEPINYPMKDPGAGALMANMSNEELRYKLKEIFNSVPYINGFNNHMGSRLTKMKDKMKIVMEEAKKRNLYFIDSKTTYHSIAYEVAKKENIPAVERTLFIDSIIEENAIRNNIIKLLKIANERGYAIGICHTHPETLKVLKELPFLLKKDKLRAVQISAIIDLLERKNILLEARKEEHANN